MRILVCPNGLNLGGSLNAVELAAAVRDRGHDVIVLARAGPLLAVMERSGLEYIPLSPGARRRPAAGVAAQLSRLVTSRAIDVVHGYEWPATVEACAGPRLRYRQPTVATVYSALVAPFLPRSLPLIVGTQETREQAEEAGHTRVTVIEPPVDIRANAPGQDPGRFRAEFGFDATTLLVAVCRLAHQGKLEGLLTACEVVGGLAGAGRKLQLAVVGDGPARQELESAAAAANTRAGRAAVTLTGALPDPRPAYAAADVVLGMGGSALRGMAFGKPLVVQGERGFWRLLTRESAPMFLHQGWYGLGSGEDTGRAGAAQLAEILLGLLDNPASWPGLGEFGRSLVVSRFSLDSAAAVAEEVYARAARESPRAARVAADAASAWTGALRHMARRKWRRRRGKPVPVDDFNAIASSPHLWRGTR